jgi:tetratricopeptide (TPR) repeat protein
MHEELERCVALAERAEEGLFGGRVAEAFELLERENARLLAAMNAAARIDPEAGIRIAASIWRFWLLRGHLERGERRLAPLVESHRTARGVVTLAVIAYFRGNAARAARLAREGLRLAEPADRVTTALAWTATGWAAQAAGRLDEARRAFDEAQTRFAAASHRWGLAVSLLNLGEVARSAGDLEAASRWYEQSLGIYRDLGEEVAVAALLCNLGFVALRRGDGGAERWFRESLEIAERVGVHQFVPGILVGLAGVRAEDVTSLRLIAEADARIAEMRSAYEPADAVERKRILAAAEARFGIEAVAAQLRGGRRP